MRKAAPQVAVLIGPQLNSESALLLKSRARKINASADSIVIAVDGGLDHCARLGLRVDCAVGDWDSLKDLKSLQRLERAGQLRGRVDLPREKDRSDFFFALKICGKLKCDVIQAYGFIGGRMDHEWAVFLEAHQWIQKGARKKTTRQIQFFSQRAQVSLCGPGAGGRVLDLKAGSVWSAFSLAGGVSGLTIQGAKYSLKNETLSPSSRGLSNESVGKKIRLIWKRGVLAVVFNRVGQFDQN